MNIVVLPLMMVPTGGDEEVVLEDELQKSHVVDTTLLLHFFGRKGKQDLKFEEFKMWGNLFLYTVDPQFQTTWRRGVLVKILLISKNQKFPWVYHCQISAKIKLTLTLKFYHYVTEISHKKHDFSFLIIY